MSRPKNVLSVRLSCELVRLLDERAAGEGLTRSQMAAYILAKEFDDPTVEGVEWKRHLRDKAKREELRRESEKRKNSLRERLDDFDLDEQVRLLREEEDALYALLDEDIRE